MSWSSTLSMWNQCVEMLAKSQLVNDGQWRNVSSKYQMTKEAKLCRKLEELDNEFLFDEDEEDDEEHQDEVEHYNQEGCRDFIAVLFPILLTWMQLLLMKWTLTSM